MLTLNDAAVCLRHEINVLERELDRQVAAADACQDYARSMNALERVFDDLMLTSAEVRALERDVRKLISDVDAAVGGLRASGPTYDLFDGLRALAADCDESGRAARAHRPRVTYTRRW